MIPGYYVAYRTQGKGTQLRLLSRPQDATPSPELQALGVTPARLRDMANMRLDDFRREHPDKEVVLIQVLETP